ncbi:MAG: HNH endonuclease [Pseudomonadota bacterium]|nr:HNH endonuclease [Pseudomonadota bacterium]
MHTLQLNADYTPIKVLPWERAIELVLSGKVVTVAAYPSRFVRSASLALPWPAVVTLRRYARARGRVGYSSRGVFARDGYTCAYCGLQPRGGRRPDREQLTLDHVVPRAHAKDGAVYLPWSRKWVRVSCWENAVTACRACNMRKADRTPSQAGMPLRTVPRVPTPSDVLRITLGRLTVPAEWTPWLPEKWQVTRAEATGVARGAG